MAKQEPLTCDESLATVSGISFEPKSAVSDENRMNFGGTGAGGYDRRGGSAAFDDFTVLCRVTVEDPGQHDPI